MLASVISGLCDLPQIRLIILAQLGAIIHCKRFSAYLSASPIPLCLHGEEIECSDPQKANLIRLKSA